MEARIERYLHDGWKVRRASSRWSANGRLRWELLTRDGKWESWGSDPLSRRFLFWTREEAEEALALRVLRDYAEQAR